ncbi:serine/threonine protein kinase [Myxococcota bacterium]|nr:serine/threonine protein kinase [Myxococcota bacterium]MBU1536261.1 serine/threonine protein kinase [Myxococcota bacterium]
MTDDSHHDSNSPQDDSQEDIDDLTGCFIGNYKVLNMIGSGAFGDVYLGRHPTIESQVAIKVLDPTLASDPEMVKRFNAEARAVNIIKHPNIIKIYDFGQLPDGRHYFTMEYLEGQELGALIKQRAPFSVKDTLRIAKQICEGLDAAHSVGVIHRDLKPDNIYINEVDGKYDVKILDFGIAKLVLSGEKVKSKHATSMGMVMGTPLYMSPEQAAGSIDEIGACSDIYSLGIILFKMLSNTFPLNAKTPRELLYKQVAEPPLKLEEVTKGLPQQLCDVINKTLIKNPRERYDSAGQLFNELKNAGALVNADLIAEIASMDSEPDLDDEIKAVRSSLTPKDEVMPYNAPTEKSGTLGFFLIMVLILAAAGGAGFIIWKKVVTHFNKRAGSSGSDMNAPMKEPPPLKPMRVVVKKPTEYHVSVGAANQPIAVDVVVNGVIKYAKRKTPFKITVPAGAKVILRAAVGKEQVEEEHFSADTDREFIFSVIIPGKPLPNKGRSTVMARPRPMITPMKKPLPMKTPRPMVMW